MMEYNKDQDIAKLTFVTIDQISDNLIKAVILSEDPSFFKHQGVDWEEFKLAMKQNWERKSFYRGASTISMQLTRNLFLSPKKNPLRKIKEIVITHYMEKELSKTRILELYLNTAEWGKGIYGAEEAARFYFGKNASGLSVEEACYMASILPSPKKWRIKDPQPWVERRKDRLLERFKETKLKILVKGYQTYDDKTEDSPDEAEIPLEQNIQSDDTSSSQSDDESED